MNDRMKQTRTILMSVFCGYLTLAVLATVLFETGILESGTATGNAQAEFMTEVVMELMTLGNIWLALRLFKMSLIRQDLLDRGQEALRKWGVLRLSLLGIPMVADALFYQIFLNTTFGYLAIILLICQPFVYPSMARCEFEVSSDNTNTNEETNDSHSKL